MENYFKIVKGYLIDLNYTITYEHDEDEIIVVAKEDSGIQNMVIGIADPILIFEEFMFELKSDDPAILKDLLQKNREIVHGAFAIDESGKRVIFRDTLQIENLDLNEFEGTLNSLSLLLSEYSDNIINYSKAII